MVGSPFPCDWCIIFHFCVMSQIYQKRNKNPNYLNIILLKCDDTLHDIYKWYIDYIDTKIII